MTLLATFKHISSKNADYGAAEAYLTFEHDEFTMKPTLDENGRLIPREDYRISSLNCGGEDFAVACMRANLRYEKNQKREDVKSHHYIISFDPRDGTDNGLTVDRAQELGEQFCKEHFPGHQALVCTHPDGHNHSGNIHVHIVINSLRIYEVTLLPYMDRPADTRAGCKHRCTNAAMVPLIPHSWMEYLESNVNFAQIMELLSKENLLKAVKQIAPQLWSILSNTFSILFSITIVFVILLYFIFILLDYEKIANGWIDLIPERYRPFLQGLAEDVEYSMNRYFRGQSLIALSVGVLLAIGFKIINFPLAVTLGLFIGVLNLIPYMQAIGIIPMILLSLLRSAETGENFWLIFGMAILVLGIVQCIQDLYLTPRIMGKAMGLNPAIILLSLSIWGTILGFIGLIIALPLTTLCLSYYKRFILHEDNELDPGNLAHQPKREKINSDLSAKK